MPAPARLLLVALCLLPALAAGTVRNEPALLAANILGLRLS